MSKAEGREEALRLAKERFLKLEIQSILTKPGITYRNNEIVQLYYFNKSVNIHLLNLSMNFEDDSPVKQEDQIIIFHYLLCDVLYSASEELITFRSFPGGQFYLKPFQSKTTDILVSKIGDNLEMLKKNLARFSHTLSNIGDFSAKINVFSNIYVVLVYHAGDEEFPPAYDILFNDFTKKVFSADDVSYIASKICFGLL